MKYWLRNLIYLSAIVLASPWLIYRSYKTGRYRRGLSQKLFGLSTNDFATHRQTDSNRNETIWLHGVSVGEVQLLAPLLERLHTEMPQTTFVLSTTTESGMKLALERLPTVECFYFPIDFSWAVQRTLRTVAPSMIVLGELELWPNLIDCANDCGVPIVVVNGRISDRSFRGYLRLRWLTRGMFCKLSHVAAQSDTYAERFRRCGSRADRVTVTGSMKFDNVGFDRNDVQVQRLSKLAGVQPEDQVVVVGSTQNPEELAACDAYVSLRGDFPRMKLIVVPRHPDRFDAVFQQLSSLPVRLLRRSMLTDPSDRVDWEVMLVDTVGELRWWWGLSEIAIVGGSFGHRGGQNMLEPAAYGANVAFGPNTSNFRDIAEMLIDGNAAERIPDLDSMADWIRRQLRSPDTGQRRGENAKYLIASQQGAIDRTVACIRDLSKR